MMKDCPFYGWTDLEHPKVVNILCTNSSALLLSERSHNGIVLAMERMTIYYSGRVQGVGFRYTVKSLTLGFDVRGFVRNLVDGRVELSIEGEKEELEAFQVAVMESGVGPLVRHQEVIWSPAENNFRGFEITG
jgi:acylphosphatase